MPATKDHVLTIARGQLGYRERPGNHNRFGRWYGMDGVAWCAIFVSWVADKSNAEDIIPRHAYTPAGAAWFVKQGRWSQQAKRGDIVYYEFPGMSRISHVGIVEAVHRDGSITAIEGNTDVAGGRTGGRVMRKRRSRSLIAGFGHPDYSTQAQMARLKREAEAAAKASRLKKARALAASKLKQAKAKAAATVLANKKKAAALAALAALAAGGTAVGATTGSPTPQPPASPTATATPAPTVEPTKAVPKPAATTAQPRKPVIKPVPTLRRILKYKPGAKLQTGPDVRRVQVILKVKADGEYGPASARATRMYQRTHGLKVDGDFGRSTALKAGMRWAPR